MKLSTLRPALAVVILLAGSLVSAQDCHCDTHDGIVRVTHIVVEMPRDPSPVAAAVEAAVEAVASEATSSTPTSSSRPVHAPGKKALAEQGGAQRNTTHAFTPGSAPGVDRADPKNLVPSKNATLHFASDHDDEPGSIDMDVVFNNPAVVLEHTEAVSNAICGDDLLRVTFANADGFRAAVQDWDIDEPFILITGAADNCSAEFERGYFLADEVIPDADELTITVTANRQDLADIAGELEMSFNSLPAAQLTRRLTLDPKYTLDFSKALSSPATIYSDGEHVDITAEEAWFSSTLTLSGKLKYSFWTVELKELYFDLDTELDASATVSAEIYDIEASYSDTFKYAPDALTYSLVDVPGIVSLGPGVSFGLGIGLDATAAVGVFATVDVSLAAGSVHLDFLDSSQTTSSGWEPQYDSSANITEAADVGIDVMADATVQLSFRLLGGLIDLSSGITASPGFENTFKIRGEQEVSGNGTNVSAGKAAIEAGIDVPVDALDCEDPVNGIEFVSNFVFSLTAFVTEFYDTELYSVTVPLVDYCLGL